MAMPHVEQFISKQFYTDEGFLAVQSFDQAVKILRNTQSALSKYCIRFHKIRFTGSEILDSLSQHQKRQMTQRYKLDQPSKMGHNWRSNPDSQQYPRSPFYSARRGPDRKLYFRPPWHYLVYITRN